jgi:hypothetical protein
MAATTYSLNTTFAGEVAVSSISTGTVPTADYIYTVVLPNGKNISDYIKINLKMLADVNNTYASNEITINLVETEWSNLLNFVTTDTSKIASTSVKKTALGFPPVYDDNLSFDMLLRLIVADNETLNKNTNPELYQKITNISTFFPSYNTTQLNSTTYSNIYNAVDQLLVQIKNTSNLDANGGNTQEIVNKYIDKSNTIFKLFFNTACTLDTQSTITKTIEIEFRMQ